MALLELKLRLSSRMADQGSPPRPPRAPLVAPPAPAPPRGRPPPLMIPGRRLFGPDGNGGRPPPGGSPGRGNGVARRGGRRKSRKSRKSRKTRRRH